MKKIINVIRIVPKSIPFVSLFCSTSHKFKE